MGTGPINSDYFGEVESDGAPIVTFRRDKVFMDPYEREIAIEEGRMKAEDPDFTETDFVRIVYPGNRFSVYDQPIKTKATGIGQDDKAHPDRFPREWAIYQGRITGRSGTPLDAMGLAPQDVNHLDKFDVFSVENLAGLTDTAVLVIGNGIQRYRDMARKWLSDNTEPVVDTAAQGKIDALEAQLAEMREMIAALQPKRGRKIEDTTDAE